MDASVSSTKSPARWLIPLVIYGGLAFVLWAFFSPVPFKSLPRARVADALNNIRMVKFAMDGFASDHNGRFPHEDCHASYGTTGKSANDLFRQLFMADETSSERVFWMREYGTEQPDDRITPRNAPNSDPEPALILQPGDNQLCYVHGQRSDSNPNRPFLFNATGEGTTRFPRSKKFFLKQAIILRVDGSAKAIPLPKDGIVRDEEGVDVLSKESKVWDNSVPDLRWPAR